MSVSDPIADMLTRIRNAIMIGRDSLTLPSSKIKLDILQILKEEGFLSDFKVAEDEDREENIFKFKAVNYTGMIPVTIKAIQEQQEIIKKLEERITQLENN